MKPIRYFIVLSLLAFVGCGAANSMSPTDGETGSSSASNADARVVTVKLPGMT